MMWMRAQSANILRKLMRTANWRNRQLSGNSGRFKQKAPVRKTAVWEIRQRLKASGLETDGGEGG